MEPPPDLDPAPHAGPRRGLPQLMGASALLALLALGGWWVTQRPSAPAERFCFASEVTLGPRPLDFFSDAALRALVAMAEARELPSVERCERASLAFRYRMVFDTESLRWHAKLDAVDADGASVWQAAEEGDYLVTGGFQYLAESRAELLLNRYLLERAATFELEE